MRELRKSTADERHKVETEALELFEGDHAAAEHVQKVNTFVLNL
jgi:hypothetical protein